MIFIHSLLRYAVLLALLYAVLVNMRGWLRDRPVMTNAHIATLGAMVLCHVQLALGIILYATEWNTLTSPEAGPFQRFIKYEHAGTMVLAVALITMGRVLSKRSPDQRVKQKRITLFYGAGLLLILWAIPWPIKEIGHGLGWL